MMRITKLEVRSEQDVVSARQRARRIAELLQFDGQDQVRIATAVSEIVRNAFRYAGGGVVEFAVNNTAEIGPGLQICVRDTGPGIAELDNVLAGRVASTTGMGLGLMGARRLMDAFSIESAPGAGTQVTMAKRLPAAAPTPDGPALAKIASQLAADRPDSAFEELQRQNKELLETLDALRRRAGEVQSLNSELEETNRGVVALYAELDERATSLRRASELKTKFLSHMSHEFRTPLHSILSLSQMLLDRQDGELAAEQERQVNFIRRSAQTLSDLVEDLLDTASIEAGKIEVRPIQFTVAEIFSTLRGVFRPLFTNPKVELVFENADGLAPLVTDEGKVGQILRNFLSNALKFTEAGEVRVSAAEAVEDRIVFAVADTGIGIAAEHQQRVFEEFEQVDGPLQRRVRGTGLGLPLCRKLAQLLGGEVNVASAADAGSTFSLVIPRIHPTAPRPAAPAPPPRRVLVVEDDEVTLRLYDRFLSDGGFLCVPARTMQEARSVLETLEPAAVILDVHLGDEESWPLLEEIKGSSATQHIPVVVVTMTDYRSRALLSGADAYQLKPIVGDWLLGQLSSLVGGGPQQKRLLIVDDDESSRYVLRSLLEDRGYEVVEATDGDEALRIVQLEPPAVIFLDLVMPHTSGFEVLAKLRETAEFRAIPIIINTSSVLADQERSWLAERVTAVLSKSELSPTSAYHRVSAVLEQVGLAPTASRGKP